MNETYKVCPTAKTQGQAVAEFLRRGSMGDENTVGICWQVGGVYQYRLFSELTDAQRAKIKRRWPIL